ncbi:MAG: isochorismatase family protein [Proteobacteria bacterium]|nr:isochorismatase family protein [Pseudomonadota bacterium]
MVDRRTSDLDADYTEAGFGNRIGFGERPVLNIVDLTMAYLDPASPLYAGVEAELAVAKGLVEEARKHNIPVIFSRVEYEPGGADGGHFYKKVASLKVFDRGSPLGNFPETLQPGPDDLVITKQYASNFFGTGLAERLREMGCDTLVIAGVTTSGCVRATALDALQNGFVPIVVADACGDRDERVQAANLFDLGAKYADVVTSDEVLAYFRSRP